MAGSAAAVASFSPSSTRMPSCSRGPAAIGSAGPVVARISRTILAVSTDQAAAGPSALAVWSSCFRSVAGTGQPPAEVSSPADARSSRAPRSRANSRSPERRRSRMRLPLAGAVACRCGNGTTLPREARRSSKESRIHSATGPRRALGFASSCGTTAAAPSTHSMAALSGARSPARAPRDSVAGPVSRSGTTSAAGVSSVSPYWTSDTGGRYAAWAVG